MVIEHDPVTSGRADVPTEEPPVRPGQVALSMRDRRPAALSSFRAPRSQVADRGSVHFGEDAREERQVPLGVALVHDDAQRLVDGLGDDGATPASSAIRR